jgi:hypothetical protein
MGSCNLTSAGLTALAEAAWPALTHLSAVMAFETLAMRSGERNACVLGAGAFAACPALEVLDLSFVRLGEAGARLLASRQQPGRASGS